MAKVAAINCDEESNKPFCGSMGVQGFPTLKIVKPGKLSMKMATLDGDTPDAGVQGMAIKEQPEDKKDLKIRKATAGY